MLDFLNRIPPLLARVTTSGKLIREIDGLRFLAIFMVVAQHLYERFYRETPVGPTVDDLYFLFTVARGFIGVFIFFTISGFILALPFAARTLKGEGKIGLKSYFLRRLTRLEPPYVIAMTLFTCAYVAMGLAPTKEVLSHYFASLFYIHNIAFQGWTPINPPVWTLEIEVQFYLLAPFLSILFFRVKQTFLRRMAIISVILLMLVIQDYYKMPFTPLQFTLLNHFHYFILGLLMADIYINEWAAGITKKEIYNYTAIIAFLGLFVTWSWEHEFLNRLAFTALLFIMVFSIFKATWLNRLLVLPWITAIGGMCYSIYLLHLPFIEFFMQFMGNIVVSDSIKMNYFFTFVIMTPFLLTVSIAFYLLVEKPCMYPDWPQRLRKAILQKANRLRFGVR